MQPSPGTHVCNCQILHLHGMLSSGTERLKYLQAVVACGALRDVHLILLLALSSCGVAPIFFLNME